MLYSSCDDVSLFYYRYALFYAPFYLNLNNVFQNSRKNYKIGFVLIIFFLKGELRMFKVQEIREIIKLVDASSIDEFVYEADGAKVKLKKNRGVTEVVAPKNEVATAPAPVAVAAAPVAPAAPAPKVEASAPAALVAETADLHKITSPMVGTYYQSPNPESPAYVKVGDKVGDESIVCIVEAMKLFNEIEAEIKGEIVEILVQDGQLVEYGQPLFLVKAE